MTVGGMHTIKNKRSILSKSRLAWTEYAKESKGKKFFFGKTETMDCSQCKRGMKASLGKQQIENKKEYAPICIPCCIGIPRRPIEKNIERGKHMEKIKDELRNGIRKYTKKQNLKEVEELFNR